MARPTVMTPETLRKLEDAFSWGCTDQEACGYAGIGMSTLYDYQGQNPEFSDRKEVLKANPVMKARKIVMDALDDRDLSTANRVIDRKEGSKVAVSGDLKVTAVNWTLLGNNTEAQQGA